MAFRRAARNLRASRRLLFVCCSLALLLTLFYYWHGPFPYRGHSRHSDRTDIFQTFVGRDSCGFGALDLHVPFEPLCETTASILASMTDGGRGGFDAPYMPRGCDMRFYTTSEICKILTRYEAVLIFGDSMMRHVTGAFSMLLRENYDFGGQQQWLHGPEHIGCHCDGQTELLFCHQADVRNVQDIYDNDPNSVACPATNRPNIRFQSLNKWPIDEGELDSNIIAALAPTKPARPYAFIFGHGLWNDVHQYESIAWIDQVQSRISYLRPYYNDEGVFCPKLFVTPNAAGEAKQDSFQVTQGNKPIVKFEKFMRDHVSDRNLDFFGTYNMSVQGTIPDGTHSGIRINILKAMTILNWLDLSDDRLWRNPNKQPEHGKNAFGSRIPTPANVSEFAKAVEADVPSEESNMDKKELPKGEASIDEGAISGSTGDKVEQEPLTEAKEATEEDVEAIEEVVVVEQFFEPDTEDAGSADT